MSLPEGLTSPPPAVPNTLISFPTAQILLVTLNRPKQLNAIPTTSHALFDALWRWYDNQPTLRCAILTGTGRAFCAGADLKEWSVRNKEAVAAASSSSSSSSGSNNNNNKMRTPSGFAGLSNRGGGGKKPIIAAVNGLCLGGGMEVVLNCDMVLAADNTRDVVFGLPEVKRGVVALAGALPRLVRIVGRQRAAEMALLGRHYDARTMEAWGLVNKVVGSGSSGSSSSSSGEGEGAVAVVAEAVRWAEELAGNSPDSVIVSREGLRLGWEPLGPEVATDVLERGMYGRMDAGENMVEGVVSFVEKRSPRWRDSKL